MYKHNIVMYHESVISIRIVQKKKNNNNNILYECITKIHWTGKSYIRLFHYLAAGNRECFIQAIEGFFSNGSRSNRPQTKSAPSQIGPKPNRPQIKSAPVKSAPSQIGPSQIGPKSNRPQIKSLYYYVFFLFNVFHSFFHTGKSHVRHLCCFLLSTCKGKYFLNSLDTIQQNI